MLVFNLNCLADRLYVKVQFGHSVLLRSAENGHADCVRLLVEAGANVDAKTDVRDMVIADL